MYILKVIFLFFFFLFEIEGLSFSETKRYVRENLFLKSEYNLAKDSQIYIIFNLIEKRILIKAKGITLKEYSIDYFRSWGHPIQPKPLTLLKKGFLIKFERKKIIPPENENTMSSSLDMLEVKDMPSRYRLKWEGPVWMYIRPKSEGVFSKFLNSLSLIKSFILIKPIGMLAYTVVGKRFTEIEIYLLNEKDSKSLFWTIQEGYQGIIYM